MQQHEKHEYLYSPSDLTTFLGCHHATFLNFQSSIEKTKSSSAISQLLQLKGLEHEATYLQSLKDQGKSVVEISKDGSINERAILTSEAMYSGADVIYQGVLLDKLWRGDADFLIRCGTPSSLGNFSYEVLDTKLGRTAEPKHIIQLCVYSELLTGLQGLPPAAMHLLLGDGNNYSFKVADFFFYYTRAKQRFEQYIKSLPVESYPEPCSHCNSCVWSESCTEYWQANNHLSLIANIQRSQADKLRNAGIRTLTELVATPLETKIPGLSNDTFVRLHSQAMLQAGKAKTGDDKFELLTCLSDQGFNRIALANEGDLFFDMEGDPLYPNGLEYLFGVYYISNQQKIFKAFWAHNHEEEKETFKQFMGFLSTHLEKHPNAYIYHYNHYETTALKRLSCRYAVCEEQLDNLLRQQRFIDLYLVVRESIRTSEPSYSIKNLETFYMKKREGAVTTAEGSIIIYNEWRETGENILLQEIADYNEMDCMSTQQLRNWLLSLKPDNTTWFKGAIDSAIEVIPRKDWEIEYQDLQQRLSTSVNGHSEVQERLSHLLEFHNREAKPQWWSTYDRQNKLVDELIDDTECLESLTQASAPEPEKRSLIYTYSFPPQEYKLKVDSIVVNTASTENIGTIVELDGDQCIVKIKRSASKEPLPGYLSIGPTEPVDAKIIRSAIYRSANNVLDDQQNDNHAAIELLGRNIPRIRGKAVGEPIINSTDLQAGALQAIANLDNSYLFIQGPPGAGKTYTCSHIIVELIKRGKKIGITSTSHKAIHNLLNRIEEVATENCINFKGFKKSTSSNSETFFKGQFIENETKTENMSLDASLFAGTAWLFSHSHFDGQLDYLFIDEAGQVATANVIAMATAAKNVILIGDQMQLGQPVQGTHPGEAGLSILEFLLNEGSTVSAGRGIFLAQTRRCKPSICSFISDAFYDSRLTAHESTKFRGLRLQGTSLPEEGIVMIEAAHTGCSQKSVEEGVIIKNRYLELLGQSFIDKNNNSRPITEQDILVVTPYNVQVNHLRSLLPNNARVGTVDKFQGQEAPIVLISMVTSSAEDLPRNIEFLYSKNRLNVAISRAQCLAVVVINPNLLEIPCKTVEQMKLVNTFCQLYEYAVKI